MTGIHRKTSTNLASLQATEVNSRRGIEVGSLVAVHLIDQYDKPSIAKVKEIDSTSVPDQIFIDWYDGSYNKPWKVWEKEGERADWVPKDGVLFYITSSLKKISCSILIYRNISKELKRGNQQKKQRVKQNKERQKTEKHSITRKTKSCISKVEKKRKPNTSFWVKRNLQVFFKYHRCGNARVQVSKIKVG